MVLALALGVFLNSAMADPFQCQTEVSSAKRSSITQEVEKRYREITDLKARFVQRSYFLGLDKEEYSNGQLYFKKPGMMDWQYETPQTQRFVADGKTLWFYQPELNQVTLGDFKDAFTSDLPVSFLLGLGNLEKSFLVQKGCKGDSGLILELAPKNDTGSLERFSLLVKESDFTPQGAKVLDAGGNETTITFIDLESNTGLPVQQFSLKIPKGVDVIDERLAEANSLPQVPKATRITETELGK